MILKKMTAGITATILMLSTISLFPQGYVSAASECVIDTSIEYQTIRGFGGMNHPEWTGQDLTKAQRQTAFGNGDDELGLTVLRVFVNPDSTQWYKALPTAQTATNMGVTVFASPWEPPANLAEEYPDSNIGKLHLPESNYGAYAQHLNNFGTYMKNNSVDLYSISVQNEPDYSSEWTHWTTDEITNFLANYGDQITSTRLMSPESFQYSPEDASWIDHGTGDGGKTIYKKILNNAKAFANCDLFGTHFYGTQRSWMDYPELENCGKEIWMTEVYVPNSDQDSANNYPEAIQVSENIHNAMVVGNMSAYTWWYIRRHYGLMTEDGKISKRGYCMAQYSKYVRPGDVRIDATEQPSDNVYVSAYKGDDNQVTIVAINKGTEGYAQQFSVSADSKITDIDRYRTSGTENLAKTENLDYTDNSFWAQLPAESVSTFVVTLSEKAVEPDENGYYFHDTFEKSNCDWAVRGPNQIGLSGRIPYMGTNALLVSERTEAWNGAEKLLDTSAFQPGKAYSFSVCVAYVDGEAAEKFALTLQYVDSSGQTRYKNIDTKTAVKGNYVQLYNSNFMIPEDATGARIIVETTSGVMNFYIDEAIGAVAGTAIDGPSEIAIPTTTSTTTQTTSTTQQTTTSETSSLTKATTTTTTTVTQTETTTASKETTSTTKSSVTEQSTAETTTAQSTTTKSSSQTVTSSVTATQPAETEKTEQTTEKTTGTTQTSAVSTSPETTVSETNTIKETASSETTAKSSESTETAPVKVVLYGDVNVDGRVDITDAVLLNKATAGSVQLNDLAMRNADCNNNQGLDGDDALLLLKFLVHLVSVLPYAE